MDGSFRVQRRLPPDGKRTFQERAERLELRGANCRGKSMVANCILPRPSLYMDVVEANGMGVRICLAGFERGR